MLVYFISVYGVNMKIWEFAIIVDNTMKEK